jgi:hypothetical protein
MPTGAFRVVFKQGLALSGDVLDLISVGQCNAFFEFFSLLGRFWLSIL